MKGATRLALLAVLCSLGLAQAYITWGPRSFVPLATGDVSNTSWTSDNNTWSVTGWGNTIAVAFVGTYSGSKWVLFNRSDDGGRTWVNQYSTHFPNYVHSVDEDMDPWLVDSMWAPSLIKLTENGDSIAVVFLAWPDGGSEVKVAGIGSYDGGVHWGELEEIDDINKPSSFSAHTPSAAADPSFSTSGGSDQHFEVAWSDTLTGHKDSICSMFCRFIGPGDVSPVNRVTHVAQTDSAKGPSIYNLRLPDYGTGPYDNYTGCAWRGGLTGNNGIYYALRRGLGGDWGEPTLIEGGFDGNLGYPSIAAIPYKGHTEGEDRSHPKSELVAYLSSTNSKHVVLAHRDWTTGSGPQPGNWSMTSFTGISGHQLYRPSVYGSGDTFYMVYTDSAAQRRAVYYASSTDHGQTWSPQRPLYPSADSACIRVFGGRAYALASGAAPYQYHRAIACAGSVRFTGPLTEVAAGSLRGCQLARAPGTTVLHRTYAVDNFISYERSSDNGATWDFQSAPDFGTNPTIALNNGNPTIVYLRGGDSVMAATLNSDSEWTIRTLYAGTSTSVPGAPSLAMFSNGTGRYGNVCFPLYNTQTGNSRVIYTQFNPTDTTKVMLDTIDRFNNSYADSACCIAAFSNDTAEVVYMHGDSIFMRRLAYSSATSNTPPDTWPQRSLVSTEANPDAHHPFCEKIGCRLWVVYSLHYQDNGQNYWVIKKTSCCDTNTTIAWEGLTGGSTINTYPTDFPCLSTSKVVAWGESSSTTHHWVVKADVADSLYVTLSNPDSNCKFVSIYADTAVQTTPSTSTTGVYYTWLQQVTGETSAVQYSSRQFLTSNADANVTMYNQGRKLALDHNDSLSSVFRTQQGSIYYSKKKDGVEGWSSSLLKSTADMPCVDDDYLNRVWVADRCFQGSAPTYDVIRCQTRASGSGTWTDFQVFSSQMAAGSTTHKVGPPAIVACLGDTGGLNRTASYIVFTVYEPMPGSGKSTTIMVKVSTTGVVYVDTLCTVQGKGDSFPSVALHPTAGQGYGLHVAWQSGTEVYTKKTTNQDQPQFTMKRTWSSNYDLSNTATWSRHPQIAADADTVMVAWVEGDSGRILTKTQTPGSAYSFWNDTVNVSCCHDTSCDYPSIALSHADSTIVEYQKRLSSTNYDIMARVNFHSSLNISNSASPSKYPHCIIHLHDGSPVISTVWTEELSTNYAEVGYKRWQLGQEGGGNTQSASVFDPSIRPCLFAPAPNPFAGTTTIRYQTNIRGQTSVVIHDVTGRKVCNLMTTYQRPGIYNLTWTGRDDRQRLLPEGIYFVRLSTPNYCEARKLILTQ